MPAKTIRVLRATSEDAFPAIEITAAVPAVVTGDGEVAQQTAVSAHLAADFAEVLTGFLAGKTWAATPLEDNEAGWTHHLRLQADDGTFRDLLVVARGIPADDLEAAAHGYESAELEVSLATGPPAGGVH